mmetsp:Transcript_33820/g.74007  ORF Transcript_33820/g.74007 Transcript_33820/m.74007 type:complete len:307 (+) Transcript_33820:107-1027(+)|eukprot:CAMPEP_0170600752 /NCGR_PEP_ID=MMETSP0224-20130122/17498_1 /TAXON_ID=285029 /ORGANISM="Togula jolla, Strain CCCM 725" /LENGTH=306 /DNA_ID=CAMNT_0010925491 /DNA_START=106 /DNA_END=1026 /DNA_ORIENTATION=+
MADAQMRAALANQLFDNLDRDGDGFISRKEYAKFQKAQDQDMDGIKSADPYGPETPSEELRAVTKRMFPRMFTFFCFLVFVLPIWLTNYVGRDRQVQYWIGRSHWIVLFLPLLFAVTHVVHVLKGAPSKMAVVSCLAGSCLLLLIVGDVTLTNAYGLGNRLKAKDCETFHEKKVLQHQWQNAKDFYVSCMEATATSTDISLAAATSLYRIQDCDGYENAFARNPGWSYLAELEEMHRCGGWCEAAQPLWTFLKVKDSCTEVVADIMYNKVQWCMAQVVLYTMLVLFFVAVALVMAKDVFKRYGVAW